MNYSENRLRKGEIWVNSVKCSDINSSSGIALALI